MAEESKSEHSKYVVTVEDESQKIAKVELVGKDGELIDVSKDAQLGPIPMVMSPWPHHHGQKK